MLPDPNLPEGLRGEATKRWIESREALSPASPPILLPKNEEGIHPDRSGGFWWLPISKQSSNCRFSHPDPCRPALRLLNYAQSSESSLKPVEDSLKPLAKRKSIDNYTTDRQSRNYSARDLSLRGKELGFLSQGPRGERNIRQLVHELERLHVPSEMASGATDVSSTRDNRQVVYSTPKLQSIRRQDGTCGMYSNMIGSYRGNVATSHSRSSSLPNRLRTSTVVRRNASEEPFEIGKRRGENGLANHGRNLSSIPYAGTHNVACAKKREETEQECRDPEQNYIPGLDGPSDGANKLPPTKSLRRRDQPGVFQPPQQTVLDLTPRDWSLPRKAFTAAASCYNLAAIYIIIGLFFGLVSLIEQPPGLDRASINWMLYANAWCFLGMMGPVSFLWPLPPLQGRKAYISSGFVLALLLLVPQTMALRVDRYLITTG